MMKYIFSILLGLFLCSGNYAVSVNERHIPVEQDCMTQTLRHNISTVLSEPLDIIMQSPGESPFVSNEKYNCITYCGVFGNTGLSRNLSPYPILRSGYPGRAIWLSAAFNSQCSSVPFYNHSVGSLGRYYIYILKSIII